MRLVDRVLGCTPEQVAQRRDLRNVYGWSGLNSDKIREQRAAKRRQKEKES
jgi:hypothetical protein